MIKVIGKNSCSKCDMVKQLLNNKNVEFDYEMLEDMEDEMKGKVLKMARQLGRMEMPLIIKDGQLIDMDQLINYIMGEQ